MQVTPPPKKLVKNINLNIVFKMTNFKLFYNIAELLSLKEVAKKQGRNIKESDFTIIKKSAFITYNGTIIWLGKYTQITKTLIKDLKQKYKIKSSLKKQNLNACFVMPAFVEAHTHLLFAGDRAKEFNLRQKNISYADIAKAGGGIWSTVKETRKLSLAELKKIAQKQANVFLQQGVTSLEVKSGYALNKSGEIKMLEAIKAIKNLNISASLLALHTLPKEFTSKDKYFKYFSEKILPVAVKKNLVNRLDIFVESMAFNQKHLKDLFKQAKKYDLNVTVHSDQLSLQGTSYLSAKEGAISVDHVNFATDKEIKYLSKADITNVFLPASDFYLKVNYPKARKFLDSGARVALATDYNPGTCPCDNISFIGLLARLEMKMTIEEVIAAYTLSAAYALGIQNQVGSLEPNKQADFICLEGSYNQLFYSIKTTEPRLKSVYRLGHLVAQKGQVVVEYALLLLISVALATLLVKFSVSRDPKTPGFIVHKWEQILDEIGKDLPDENRR